MHVIMDPKVFVTALKAMSLAISTDFTRANLNSLRFGYAEGDDRLTMCATNGHWLAEYAFNPNGLKIDGSITVEGEKTFALIALEDVKAIIKKVDVKTVCPVMIEFGPTEIVVKQGGSAFTFRPVDALFPPIKQVIPPAWCRDVLPEGRVSFSAEYFGAISKAFDAFLPKDESAALLLDFGGEFDPVRITHAKIPLVVVLMVCKTDVKRAAPARQTPVKEKHKKGAAA